MAKSRKSARRRVSLAAFLRKLWANADLMERFSRSHEGRREVISEFNLSPRNAKLLLDGCVRDLVVELAGGAKLTESTTGIISCENGGASVACGHPECNSFMAALAKGQPAGKKRGKAKKKR